jgi:hypothetical protein
MSNSGTFQTNTFGLLLNQALKEVLSFIIEIEHSAHLLISDIGISANLWRQLLISDLVATCGGNCWVPV